LTGRAEAYSAPDRSVAFTAIDVQDVAVDERSFVRRDEDDRVGSEPPTIDLVIGYNKTNTSPILGLFLPRVDQLKKKAPQRH
jgi:hypothetical protein